MRCAKRGHNTTFETPAQCVSRNTIERDKDYIKQTSWDDDYGSGDESCDGYGEAMTYGNSCNEACGTNPEDCKQIATTYSCWCIDGLKYINQECVNGTNCSCTDSNARSVLGNPCYDDCNMVEEVCDLEELYWYCNCIEDYYKINNTCQPAANCPS
ncbi:hypothetical protein DMENIID0001_115490 [Sergentomyia squamirostris]